MTRRRWAARGTPTCPRKRRSTTRPWLSVPGRKRRKERVHTSTVLLVVWNFGRCSEKMKILKGLMVCLIMCCFFFFVPARLFGRIVQLCCLFQTSYAFPAARARMKVRFVARSCTEIGGSIDGICPFSSMFEGVCQDTPARLGNI